MAGNILEFNDSNFRSEVLESPQPVLVDFWAPWCVPCLRVTPIVEAVAEEFSGKARVGKLNIDESPQTATEYRISSIPALVVFKGGQVVDKLVGVQPKEKLAGALKAQLADSVSTPTG
jgi:thioredoxin 1